MQTTRLHIIAFDVPYPADYGGVIDIYYKLKSLHEAGIKIHLHCFEYGRGEKKELEQYCETVSYYKRKVQKHLLFNSLPYIVASRSSDELMKNLMANKYPVLFEGLHCCYHLEDPRLNGRKKIVRMHNIEHAYYAHLGQVEKKFFKKKYFEQEARKLEKFEPILKKADAVAAISPGDTQQLNARYGNAVNIMAFHPHEKIEIKEGKGDFALYHGSLSIGENNKAALFLINEVFTGGSPPLIIAGNGASAELKEAVKKNKDISLRENISTQEIHALIQQAQVNILPTFQATGIKLKLLSALYIGRHCVVNTPMVENTGLEPLCVISNSPAEMKKEVSRLMDVPFDSAQKQVREKILLENFSNEANAKKLIGLF